MATSANNKKAAAPPASPTNGAGQGGAGDTGKDGIAVPKGKLLFKQGEKGDAAYVVTSGAIGLFREMQGRKMPLATVRRGELYGEMAVIDNSPRMATAFAMEDSTVNVIPVEAMVDKLKRADPFIRTIVFMLQNNLRHLHDSHTPKPRSLVDAVNNLHRQCEIVSRFLQGDVKPEVRTALEKELKALDGVLKELLKIALAHRGEDRRENAVPAETDLPT